MAEKMPHSSGGEASLTPEEIEREHQDGARQESIDAQKAIEDESKIADAFEQWSKTAPRKLAGAFPRKKDETPAEYIDRLRREVVSEPEVLTAKDVAGIFRDGAHNNETSRVLDMFPKVEGEDQIAYEQRIMKVFSNSKYEGSSFDDLEKSHQDLADDISYRLHLSELEADKDKYPREPGMDTSMWRAKYQIPDKESWLKGERRKVEVQKEFRDKVADITGSEEDSRMSFEDLQNYAARKNPQHEESEELTAELDVDALLAATYDRLNEDSKFKKYVEDLGYDELALKSMPAEGLFSLMRYESEDDEEDKLEGLDVDELLEIAYARMNSDSDFKKYLEDLGYDELALKSMPAEGLRSLLTHKSESAEGNPGEKAELDVDTLLAAVYDRLNEDKKFKEYVENLGFTLQDLRTMPAEGLKSLLSFESEDDAEEGEGNKEKLSELEELKNMRDKIREMAGDDLDFRKYVNDKIGGFAKLEKLSKDELQELIDGYEAEGDKEKLSELEELKNMRDKIREMAGDDPDFRKYVNDKIGGFAKLEKLSKDELQELIDGYKKSGEGAEEKTPERIIIANLDATKDAEELAHDMAMRMHQDFLNEKVGFIRGVIRRGIFGDMFKEASIIRYERKAREQIQTSGLSKAGIERFTTAFARDAEEQMIHSDAGEQYSAYTVVKDENGEEHVERKYKNDNGEYVTERLGDDDKMAQQTIKLRALIEKYAKQDGKFNAEAFRNEVEELRRGEKNSDRAFSIDNYAAAVEALKGYNENEEAMKNALEGFTFINGEARRSIRSEAHRDALDNITHKIINGRIGRFVPAEAVAVGVGAAYTILKKGSTTASKAVLPVFGGAAAASIFAGIKERDRMASERMTAERQKAMGQKIDAKAGKYTRQMWETLQTMENAGTLTGALAEGLEKINNPETSVEDRKTELQNILLNLSQVDAAVNLSDRTGHDLISYNTGAIEGSSDVIAEHVEEERLAMDIARAEARKAIFDNPEAFGITEGTDEEKKQKLVEMLSKATKNREKQLEGVEGAADADDIERSLSASEQAFKKLRRKRVAGRMLKTGGLTFGLSALSQEGVAAFSDEKHGIIDHLTGHQDNPTAKSTFLANAFGMKQEVNIPGNILESDAELTDEQLDNYRKSGAIVTEASRGSKTVSETISESENHARFGTDMKIRRTWLDNDTSNYDRNELGLNMSSDGRITTNFVGDATHAGRAVEAFNNSEMKALVTINGHKYVLDGVMQNGQMDFGDAAKAIGIDEYLSKGQFDYVEAFVDNGAGADGLHEADIFATIVGEGRPAGNRIISDVLEEIKYNVVEPDVTKVVDNGVAMMPPVSFFTRRGLENAHAGQRQNIPEVQDYDYNWQPRTPEAPGNETPEPNSVTTGSEMQNPNPNGDNGGETPNLRPAPETSGSEAATSGGETTIGGGETPNPAPTARVETVYRTPDEESQEAFDPAETYREYLANQFTDGYRTSSRSESYPNVGNIVVGSNYSEIVQNNGENAQSLRNASGELAQVNIDNYTMPIAANDETIQAYAENSRGINAEELRNGINIWNSLGDTDRENFLMGRVPMNGLDGLVRAGILNPFNPNDMASVVKSDQDRFQREHNIDDVLGRVDSRFSYVAESQIRPEESVFENTAIDAEHPESSIRAEINKVDPDQMNEYVSNYFKDGYNLPTTVRLGGREFMKAAQSWDKFVPTGIKRQILEGGNADTLIGNGWAYWIKVFEDMGLINISRETEAQQAQADNGESQGMAA